MQIKLKNENGNKYLAIISILTVAFALLATFVNDFVFPVPAALFAVILLIESGKKRIFSCILAVTIAVLNIVSFVFFNGFSLVGFEILVIGAVLCVCFSKNLSKAETAFILCFISSVFIILSAFSLAVLYTKQFSFDAIGEFYSKLYDSVKSEISLSMSAFAETLPEGRDVLALSADQISSLLDSLLSVLISVIVILSFFLIGFTLKVFSFAVLRISTDREGILSWRFKTGSLFAYFYLILLILSIFTASSFDLFSVLVANLTNIFCVVYAYVGFNFALGLLSVKRSVAFSFILLIIGILLFSSIMIDILAIVGAFVTINSNKALPRK